MMHGFCTTQEQCKYCTFNFTDLNIPKRQFPNKPALKAVKDIVEDFGVKGAGRQI